MRQAGFARPQIRGCALDQNPGFEVPHDVLNTKAWFPVGAFLDPQRSSRKGWLHGNGGIPEDASIALEDGSEDEVESVALPADLALALDDLPEGTADPAET